LRRAKNVRKFLELITVLYAKKGLLFRWDTPVGLPVVNSYLEPDIHTVEIWPGGKRRSINLAVGDLDEVRGRKAKQSVSPNFVHSLDAAHLHKVALAAKDEGIGMVAVHDSFGCLASRAKRFNKIIREQFVELYNSDPLADILERARRDLPSSMHADLPDLPKRGDLDLNLVLNSFHAFK
jgi:DNA-directed RNA polymerase